MASDERKEAGDLNRFSAFEEHSEKYHIFQALRLIEAKYADQPRFGRSRRPKQDSVRLKQRVDMAFSSSTVARFKSKNEQTGEPGELSQYMFGLFGPNGPLPLHLTEYAYNRQRSFRDPTFKAFGDMFHHRMLSLFYRAYASGEPTSSFDRVGEVDPFAQKVAAFAGLKGSALSDRDAMPDLAKLRYAGRLAHGTRNEEGLLALISGFFGAQATMESFVGTWLELDKKDTWELGNPHNPAKLGQSCSIGSKVWTRQAKFRFRVGPVGLSDYKRLLPGGDSLQRLKSLVNNYMGEAMMWDMNLVLAKGEAEQAVLLSAVADESVSVVVSHEEELITNVERAEDVPFSAAQFGSAENAKVSTENELLSENPFADPSETIGAQDNAPALESEDRDSSKDASTDDKQSDGEWDDVQVASSSEEADGVSVEGQPKTDADSGLLSETEGLLSEQASVPNDFDDLLEGKRGGDADSESQEPEAPPPHSAPLDMEKTVVIPVMAPRAPQKVSDEIDFGHEGAGFQETIQIPPLSEENRHEEDTRPKPTGVYLGWTAWLGTPPGDRDLDQLFIQSDAQPGE